MKRILVDFNSAMRDAEGRVELGKVGSWQADELPKLTLGERVLLWDYDIEVEAVVDFDAEHRLWLARPDWTTRHFLETEAGQAH